MSILISLSRKNNLLTPVLLARRVVNGYRSPHFYGLGTLGGHGFIFMA